MVGQNPFEVTMLPGENFGQYLAKVTMAMVQHVADPNSPFHDPATRARCLLSGLPEQEPWIHFRQKYHSFIETGDLGEHANHFGENGNPWICVLEELTLRDAADMTGTTLARFQDAFPEAAPPENPPIAPEPPLEEDPPPQQQSPVPESPINEEGYESDPPNIWAGDDGYDIWGEEDDEGASDSSGVVSVINIPESPEVVELSSEDTEGEEDRGNDGLRGNEDSAKEDSWSSGSGTSNSSDPDYKPRGWNRKRSRRE